MIVWENTMEISYRIFNSKNTGVRIIIQLNNFLWILPPKRLLKVVTLKISTNMGSNVTTPPFMTQHVIKTTLTLLTQELYKFFWAK